MLEFPVRRYDTWGSSTAWLKKVMLGSYWIWTWGTRDCTQ